MDFDFQLEHLDTESSDSSDSNSAHTSGSNAHESMVLNDLTKQIEELQNKLKLSYRKLFLFENENQKLLKDKNFYFYEKNNLDEEVQMVTEKMENLSRYNSELEQELNQTSEKMQAFEDLTKTQSIDLRRLTKFHGKIQNIIKPYVQKMKSDLHLKEIEITKLHKVNYQYLELTQALNLKTQELIDKNDSQLKKFEYEKKTIVSSYEEQIHSLSKEILDFQEKISFLESEVQRLKKANETKNFLENEVVKFKRTHSEDQNIIQNLKTRLNEFENQNSSLVYDTSELIKTKMNLISDQENQSSILEATRRQLSNALAENEKLEMRLKMLERLNSHLSMGLVGNEKEISF